MRGDQRTSPSKSPNQRHASRCSHGVVLENDWTGKRCSDRKLKREQIFLFTVHFQKPAVKSSRVTYSGRDRDPGRVQTNLQQKFHPRNNHLKVTCARLTSSTSEHGRPLRSMQIPATPAHDANASHKNNNQEKKKEKKKPAALRELKKKEKKNLAASVPSS